MYLFGARTKSLVGLDIGSSAIKVIELDRKSEHYRLVTAGVETLPLGAIVDGLIIDHALISNSIKRLYKRLNLKSQNVSVALSGGDVIAKRLSFPLMTDDELDYSIRKEARQFVPFESQDVFLDYQELTDPLGEALDSSRNVLLVAAKKTHVEALVSVVEQAGCVPVVVDIDAFAFQNAYELNYGTTDSEMVLLVNAGASSININVVRGGQSLFVRNVPIGGNAYSEALKKLDLGFDEIDFLKRGSRIGRLNYDLAEPIVVKVTQSLVGEIAKVLDFFRSIAEIATIERIVLTGGVSCIDGFPEVLSEYLDVEVKLFDSLKKLSSDEKLLSDDQWFNISPVAAVAVGLALRQQRER